VQSDENTIQTGQCKAKVTTSGAFFTIIDDCLGGGPVEAFGFGHAGA
jgi:hypothetical protein